MNDFLKNGPGPLSITRRGALFGGLTAALTAGGAKLSFGAPSTLINRLVVINVRGGLDGLAAVIPYGDPNLVSLRKELLPKTYLSIDGFYGLDPSMPNLSTMFANGEALAVHAVGPIVDTRSHFEAQDYLASGTGSLLTQGWLNRVLGLLTQGPGIRNGLACNPTTPLVIRGPVQTAGYSVDPYTQIDDNLTALMLTMTSGDALLGPIYQTAYSDRATINYLTSGLGTAPTTLEHLAQVAGSCLASNYGPCVAYLEMSGVDTHSNQVTRLSGDGNSLAELDSVFAQLKSTLGAMWSKTVVMTMTEFGRTAAPNGSSGTDHGTAFSMLLAGGAVAGGRVVVPGGGWPGLSSSALFQGRDLAPAAYNSAASNMLTFPNVVMGVLQQHMGLPNTTYLQTIFPGSSGNAVLGLVTG